MEHITHAGVKIALRKTSLVDYPGKIASVLFFGGCELRCPWCHNRELVLMESTEPETFIGHDDALAHITKRRNVLGGVVLSGGEPTLYRDLPVMICRIKDIGLSVKLDTNGMNPAMLEKLFETTETSPDYIALDLKLAPQRYGEIAPNVKKAEDSLRKSAELIRNSGIKHEYRTLALPIITEKDIIALAELTGSAPWYVRAFKPGNCLDPSWNDIDASTERATGMLADMIRTLGKDGIVGSS
ncbi:MAG: anaerobic ribonucleoside-triphosphate reductase activating protein [Treponema sp.]|jgi:pyruvate formate lyase activating enzyme|nr:anaerobic ribonucleoside-triphosphate reductase activating protein [Treponema sp.]